MDGRPADYSLGVNIFVADRLWDGISAKPLDRGFVRLEDGMITGVGRSADLPASAVVTDLGDATLMPGLINGHVHLTLAADGSVLETYLAERERGLDVLVARAKDNLFRAVSVGCTTIRDLGTLNDVVLPLRAAVREGTIPGPDIVAAGEGITSPGGHCHFFGIEARGVDAVRAAVKRQADVGVDVIKIFATGGNLTPGTDPFAPQYEVDELVAAVDESRRAGLPIAGHAHAPEGIRRVVAAHVNTIEHCLFETPDGIEFDERAAAGMAERGIAVLPTTPGTILAFMRDPSLLNEIPEPGRTIARRISAKAPIIMRNFRRMRELGVDIVVGNDAGIPQRPFDGFPGDLMPYYDEELGMGMGAHATLVAATSGCARALGLADRGELVVGKRADLLAVGGNPLEHIGDIADTRLVLVGGQPVLDRTGNGTS